MADEPIFLMKMVHVEKPTDNTEFVLAYKEAAARATPARYIITSQTPKAGALAWPGTVVQVVIEDRDAIAVEAFNNIEPVVKDKYKRVGDLHADLDKEPAADVKKILGGNPKYPPSSPVEKETVDKYITEQYGAGAEKAKVYENLSFLVNI